MSTLLAQMRRAVREARLAPIELALADWGLRHGGSEPVALALALTARAVADGHACLVLDGLDPGLPGDAPFCTRDTFADALRDDALVGAPGLGAPLILDGSRLYFHRHWTYETHLATRLRQLIEHPPDQVDTTPMTRQGTVFDHAWVGDAETHWQAVAAAVALRHRFTVISGGPGTGKTYTVLRLIRLLLDAAAADGRRAPVVRLAAPTGKAAARMMASIRAGLEAMAPGATLVDQLPGKASTLHRLLGIGGGTVLPRHHRDNPLAADVVIVDEASMIDLPLMAKLADALPDHARLVLLGDRYQLASVESGSVLAELCAAAGVNAFSTAQRAALAPLVDQAPAVPAPGPLADHVVTLQTSHRFHPLSPIGRLASAVNAGDAEAALAVARERDPAVHFEMDGEPDLDRLAHSLAETYAPLAAADDPQAALDLLDGMRLLCATRVGPAGASAMNQRIEAALATRGQSDQQQRWYPGRPVIVTRNDYRLGLFNGDTGICLRGADEHLRVWFATESGLRPLTTGAVPAHETAYAMTVHRSQGSEFESVWLLLPFADSPAVTRELVYTGMTRARSRVVVLGPQAVFRAAVARVIRRDSGLRARLAGPSTPI